MDSIFSARAAAEAIPIWFVTSANYPDVQRSIGAQASAFAKAAGFEPKAGRHLLLPGNGDAGGALGGVLFGVEGAEDAKDGAKDGAKDPFLTGRLPHHLPDGIYRFANEPPDARLAALAFALGAYRFTRYRKAEPRSIKLDLP